ncbi:MAG: Ig-like domain-containing protein [Antricoccus sp.]
MSERQAKPTWDQILNRRQAIGGVGVAGLLLLSACTTGKPKNLANASGKLAAGAKIPSKQAAAAAQITIAIPDGSTDVSPATPLTVSVVGGTITGVKVTDANGAVINGAPDATAANWANTDPLVFGANYSVFATASNADGKSENKTASFTTVTPASLVYPGIGPLDGTTLGVGIPVRVYFDHPATDRKTVEQALKVTTTPAQTGSWNWISDTEVHWRPQVYFLAGTTVSIETNIFGVAFGRGVFGKVNRTVNFAVGDAVVSKADTQSHQMQVFKNGTLLRTIPISAGEEVPGKYTHNGVHVINDKFAELTMDSSTFGLALDAPGGYTAKVQWATRMSNNGEFVHSAPWSLAQQGNSNVSHGCLNASPANAEWFYNLSTPGDIVEVSGSPIPLTQADGDIYDWTIPWATWQQGTAIK